MVQYYCRFCSLGWTFGGQINNYVSIENLRNLVNLKKYEGFLHYALETLL